MAENVSRRELFGIGVIAGGALAAGSLLASAEVPAPAAPAPAKEAAAKPAQAAAAPAVPKGAWGYAPLDPEKVAERGYSGYYPNQCCYGSFEAIIGSLADAKGGPYATFPVDMMKVGEGGMNGWASLCGALNGAAMAMSLILPDKERKPLVDELFTWYEQAELPGWKPKVAKNPTKDVQNAAHSILCHASVGKWCEKAGVNSFSKERSERCARVTGAVAKKAVELMNAQAGGTFKAVSFAKDETKHCRSCHDKAGLVENTRGQMECAPCHVEPRVIKKGGHY
jgi:hypothetical protein